MSSVEVAVIDYGVGNLLSVRRALEHCGASVALTAEADVILGASRVVLPGVGAFGNAMSELRRRGMDIVTQEVAARGIPLLGICLGMQMLLDESEEFGSTPGLGLIPGRVIPISPRSDEGRLRKIPHIGWNKLLLPAGRTSWANTPLQNLAAETAVYFLHSYVAEPSEAADRLADCVYEGALLSAAISRGSVVGCQFHPEKSGETGLNILRSFLTGASATGDQAGAAWQNLTLIR